MSTIKQLKILLVVWDVFTILGTISLSIAFYYNFKVIKQILEML